MNIVFTAILGDCDSLKPAPTGVDRAVCFVTDPSSIPDTKGWELIAHPATNYRREAWRLRCVPHQLFGDYDRVIWVDASYTLTDVSRLLHDTGEAPIAALRHHERKSCYREGQRLVRIKQADEAQVARQLLAYRQARFRPDHLSVSCIVVRDRSAAVERFNETWAAQIAMYPGDNTQLSLDYSAWTQGITIKALQGSRHKNPYAIHDHQDHRRRRKPYDKVAA
jgi:hypothetical protein